MKTGRNTFFYNIIFGMNVQSWCPFVHLLTPPFRIHPTAMYTDDFKVTHIEFGCENVLINIFFSFGPTAFVILQTNCLVFRDA